ncbi:MAG: hypothetical protein CSA49_01000 [Gammaproteobacteria bacterium]|nr:MAG: hypothetical protein CSA49_01000 [Gammaproteobacteria bacterium]
MKICSSTYGDLKVEKAQTKSGAFEFLDELLVLHRARAKELDRQSNFDTDYGHKFHTELINNRFDHQELDFLRVTAGNTLVGVLYNLNYQGRVYFFQSGIRSESDNKLKPGMICHHLAIQYYAEDEKNKIYDFLAGPERYKKSLSTQDELIYWYVLQKNHLRFKLEKAIISNLKKRK